MLRDLDKGGDKQINATLAVIAATDPDIVILTDFDYDFDNRALGLFALQSGYPHHFALLPNSGLATGLDMDGDGYLGDGSDAQGFGKFAGDGGMAILSRIAIRGAQDFSDVLWGDLAGARWPMIADEAFPSQAVFDVQRLSSTGHWAVTFAPDTGPPFHVVTYDATPPVFDGPEDRNGLRNRDELRLAHHIASGLTGDFVVAGNANLDPVDGQGYTGAMAAFLAAGLIQDPAPRSAGAGLAADPDHRGDPSLDTADWPDDGPGNLRVSYVLPSMGWTVADAGVFWPAPDDPDAALLGKDGLLAGPHHLVWVDVSR